MKSRKFKIKYTATITQKEPGELYFWFSEPQSNKYQKIVSLQVNQKEKSSYPYIDNEIRFYSERTDKFVFEVVIEAELGIDEKPASLEFISVKESPYLEEEKFLKRTALVDKLAEELPENKVAALKELMKYIVKNFEYRYPVINRGVENLTTEKLTGDCGEYSSLFVTTARRLGIEARNESGFVIYPDEDSVTEHAWASCKTPDGWLDFDPQYSQLDNNVDMYFGKRSDYRISFCHGFNIPLNPELPEIFSLDFWKELCLPADRNFVQIMQPIFFACEHEFEVEDEAIILNK